MGLVINRPSPLTLKDLGKGQSLEIAPSLEKSPVFVGGPVEPQRGFVLHDDEGVEERHEIVPGLFLSLTQDALGPLLLRDEGHLRFCLGYAGWSPKQIEQEISEGAWLYTEATAASVLVGDPEQLWDATLRGMGFDPARLFATKGVH
jgi:putative transcriptional regulator